MTTQVLTGLLLLVLPVAYNLLYTLHARSFDYPDILRQPTDHVLDRFAAGGGRLVQFQTLNRYLGVAVGEHLGYLFTGLWTALAGIALIQSDLLHPLFGVVGLVLAPLFVLGSLEFVGPFEIQRLEARRHPGPTRLYRMVGMAAGPWHRSAAHRLTLGSAPAEDRRGAG